MWYKVIVRRAQGVRRKIMRRFIIALALALAVLVLGGCESKLVVGVVLPETGDAAEYGASIKSGVKLAFDEALTAKTAPEGLQVIYRDSGSDPARAKSELEALYDQGALIVIGGATTEEAKAMIPAANRRERILISPSASAPELTRMSVYFFRVYPSDDYEGRKAADLLFTRGVRRILIVHQDNDYTRGLLGVFMGAFRGAGGEIKGTVRFDETDWKRRASDVLTAFQPDGVYVAGYGDAILTGLRYLKEVGYKGIICTTSAINTAAFLSQASGLAEGVFFPLASFDTRSAKEPVRSFVDRYNVVYNLTPDIYAAHGYDAALATMHGLTGLRTRSGGEIQVRLKGLGDTMGVTGPLAFDDYGNIKHYPRDHWIHAGKVEDFNAWLEKEKDRIRKQLEAMMLGGGGR
jgi:branched-chain amino acid transport system substrate-binding protein